MLRMRSLSMLFSFVLLAGLAFLLALLHIDPRTAPTASREQRWSLAPIAGSECNPSCGAVDRFSAGVREELGSFASEIEFRSVAVSLADTKSTNGLALIDPSGTLIARFSIDSKPGRTASRIRVLLTSRFDPEWAEDCPPRDPTDSASASLEVRDRWQKGL